MSQVGQYQSLQDFHNAGGESDWYVIIKGSWRWSFWQRNQARCFPQCWNLLLAQTEFKEMLYNPTELFSTGLQNRKACAVCMIILQTVHGRHQWNMKNPYLNTTASTMFTSRQWHNFFPPVKHAILKIVHTIYLCN